MESICYTGVSHLLQENQHGKYICYSKRRVDFFISFTRKRGRNVFDRRFHICYKAPLYYKEWNMESVGHKEDSQQLHIEQRGGSYDNEFSISFSGQMLKKRIVYLLQGCAQIVKFVFSTWNHEFFISVTIHIGLEFVGGHYRQCVHWYCDCFCSYFYTDTFQGYINNYVALYSCNIYTYSQLNFLCF